MYVRQQCRGMSTDYMRGVCVCVCLCRLRESSTEECVRAGELAAKIGVKHHILSVDWQGSVPIRYKIQNAARTQRYDSMMEFCTKHSFPTLMTAHHLDDQIGMGLHVTL